MSHERMRVLGIDPGYDRLGLAVVETPPRDGVLCYSSCFESSKDDAFEERLHGVAEEIRRVVAKHTPDCVAIETLYFSKNKKTALRVSEARGVVLATAASCGLPVHEYSPQAVKIATTGYGASTKEQVAAMVEKLLRPAHTITRDDEYDAIAVALTHAVSLLSPEK